MSRKLRQKKQVDYLESLVDEDEAQYHQHIDIAPVPNYDDSSGDDSSESNSDLENDDVSDNAYLPYAEYEHVKSSYSSTQRFLEPNHTYEWVIGTAPSEKKESYDFTNFESINSLSSKNVYELFQIFFTDEMRNHILEATRENGFDLSNNSLNKFILVIMISIFNSRKSQSDYWSSKSACPIVKKIMSKNDFPSIERNIKFYKTEEKNMNDKVWKVKTLYNLFRKNIIQFGFFRNNLSIDEVMVKYYGRFE